MICDPNTNLRAPTEATQTQTQITASRSSVSTISSGNHKNNENNDPNLSLK